MKNFSKYLGMAVVLAGCATATPAPTEQLALSRAAVANAVSAGAPEFAAPDMSSAQDKLARATVAMTAENYDVARMLAEQAQVDAELAAAKARSAKALKAAHAVEEDSRVLREELNRKGGK
ncbi:MAG TPA: DUF4398 domain-containing protein [Burkholderiales bacterium]|nr:DUF4398 domain-containing protein [Burkholderiales bacterium]